MALTLSVLLLACAGGVALLVGHYNGRIRRISGLFGTGTVQASGAPSGAENVLLVGSDSRGDLAAGQGPQGTGSSYVRGQRSDTIILAHLSGGASRRAELVSFPRDSYVQIPAYTDPRTGHLTAAHPDKLNSAFAEGGPKLLIATIRDLTGVRVDHFVQVDFNGFKAIVDQLGGVEVCLSVPAREHFSGVDLPAGRQVVRGDQALAFVRQRHGLANGDLDRIRRQQQFLSAITRKVLSSGTLLNPYRLNGFLNALTSALQVDSGLDVGGLQRLAERLRNFNAGGVVFTTVPISSLDSTGRTSIGLSSVVLLDPVQDAQLFAALAQDRDPGAARASSGAPSPVTIPPRAITVRVVNVSGRPGLGRRAANELRAAGFLVPDAATSAPDGGPAGGSSTVVRYGSSRQDSARTVLAALPGSVGMLDPTLGATLKIDVGESFRGTVPVKLKGAPRVPQSSPDTAPRPTMNAGQDPCAP